MQHTGDPVGSQQRRICTIVGAILRTMIVDPSPRPPGVGEVLEHACQQGVGIIFHDVDFQPPYALFHGAAAGSHCGLLCMQSCQAWHITSAESLASAARYLWSRETAPITVAV